MKKRGASVTNIVLVLGLLVVGAIAFASLQQIMGFQSRESQLEMADFVLEKIKNSIVEAISFGSKAEYTITIPIAVEYTLNITDNMVSIYLPREDIYLRKNFDHGDINIIPNIVEDAGKIRLFFDEDNLLVSQRKICDINDAVCDSGCIMEGLCDPACPVDTADGTCNPVCADANDDGMNNWDDIDGVCDPDCSKKNGICDPDCESIPEYEGDFDCHEGNGECEQIYFESCSTTTDCACTGSNICCPERASADDTGCTASLGSGEGEYCDCRGDCTGAMLCSRNHCCEPGYEWSIVLDECIEIEDEDDDNECGEEIVELAMEGMGHPYCLGAGNWPGDDLPPLEGDCPGLWWMPPANTECDPSLYDSRTSTYGKCPIDCSAFTFWVYEYYANQINDPSYKLTYRNAYTQAENDGRAVDHDPMTDWSIYTSIAPDFDELQKGDLIFFSQTYGGNDISHVGIYVGDQKIIHSTEPTVEIADLSSPYYTEHYIGAKRLCPDAGDANLPDVDCFYCGINKQLLLDYYPTADCDMSDVCCKGPCPPGTILFETPYYAQCSFGPEECNMGCGPVSMKMAFESQSSNIYDVADLWNCASSYGEITTLVGIVDCTNAAIPGFTGQEILKILFSDIENAVERDNPLINLIWMDDYTDETADRGAINFGHFFMMSGISDDEVIINDPFPSNPVRTDHYQYGHYMVIRKSTIENSYNRAVYNRQALIQGGGT